MSYNGSGTFNINSAGQPVVTGTVISSTAFNALTADLGTGLSTALTKDGQTVATARIPFAAGINSSLVTDATNTTTGSIITAGGVGVAKALFVGTTANIAGITTVAAGSAALPAIVSTTGTADTGLWFPAADTVAASTAGTERLRIDSSGNVGIGTTSPSSPLNVASALSGLAIAINGRSSDNLGAMYFYANNGSTQYSTITASATEFRQSAVPAASVQTFYTNASERMRIDASGIVTMSAYGAGAATFSASGVISSVSDETWKVKDGAPVDTDAMLNKLEPGYWYYNDEKKETFGKDRQLGFYAQNVNAAIGPEAAPEPETVVTKNDDGTETSVTKPWGYYDRSVLAVTVMSLQKALATIESLTARITALEAK